MGDCGRHWQGWADADVWGSFCQWILRRRGSEGPTAPSHGQLALVAPHDTPTSLTHSGVYPLTRSAHVWPGSSTPPLEKPRVANQEFGT